MIWSRRCACGPEWSVHYPTTRRVRPRSPLATVPRSCRDRHPLVRFSRIVVKRDAANLSLLAKCIESSQSHGSNRIRADEFLNVTDLGIGAILCRGTYPEHSLWVNAAKPETRKAVAVEDVAESA